jgi:pimeloyl-ACP methyl ester carboxylesterase
MPLVIEMPYAVRVERPFLESALAIGWPKALDDLSRAADISGLSVAVIYGRGDVHDAPIGEADTFEAINDILSHYAIDRQKIYLFGTCEGGFRALMLAEHYPSTFAGVGVYGPTIGATWSGRVSGSQDTGVFSQMDSLASVPVHILQGEFDYDPPRDILNEFFGDLKKISPSSELTIVPDGMHGTSAAEKLLFPWLAQFKADGANDHFGADYQRAIAKGR